MLGLLLEGFTFETRVLQPYEAKCLSFIFLLYEKQLLPQVSRVKLVQ